jgi:signal transduction histidine kinase
MDQVHTPIPIRLRFGDTELVQQVHYGESRLVRQLRIFPYVQLFIVGLFILVGYLGFSYVRRSEQRSLWVGMAKEAAHQLGTPLSSLMGWVELLRSGSLNALQQREAFDEIEKDVDRLRRVAQRFSEIGSMPRLERQPLAPVLHATADYIRRRMPSLGKQVVLVVEAPEGLQLPLNAELFEWVIENLLKNALDAIEGSQGEIAIRAYVQGRAVHIDVHDTGKGIERREWKNIFRPGYSTKKRGWGLGLNLAKRIVEDYHGGTIALVYSKPGQGSTFRITLPLG